MSRHAFIPLLLVLAVFACSEDGTGPDGGPPPGDRLAGASGALASTAIVRLAYEPRLEDYSNDHPQVPGLRLSRRVLNLVLRPQVTVGQANALLEALGAEIVGGIPGTASLAGILALRLPTLTHADMESTLAVLRQDSRVAHAVQERLADPAMVPATDPAWPSWSWDLVPAGGNWGLEISRVPQLWNLNAAVRKTGDTTLVTGVLDAGFAAQHSDLVFLNSPPAGTTPENTEHGTHVAGIIGALSTQPAGIDGVNPFARLLGGLDRTIVWDLYAFLIDHPEMDVLNISMGGHWADSTNLNTDVAAQQIANQGGATLRQALALVEAELGSLPVIVTAAGNESNTTEGLQPAAYASEFNNAGLLQGAQNIIVVESLNLAAGAATRRASSNVGGHVSAPGGDILSTIPGTYGLKSGTSMAAPHVAGLVGYLYALDPSLPRATLTSNPVRALILATAVPAAGGASPRMDAYAAALALDDLHGNDRVLRLLADLDDGTVDGNTRLAADGTANVAEDVDGDGGRGDGAIDMSDFRRWRDAFLDLDRPSGYALDGDPAHPKRDLNGNGRTGAQGDDEFLYPWLDLNGDGKVALAQRAYVGGAIRAEVTDLEVLMARFDDPDYPAAALGQLIRSGDAHVDPSACLGNPDVAGIRTWVEVTGSGVLAESRSEEPATTVHVYTLAENALGWTLHLQGLDSNGDMVSETERQIDVRPGSDEHWKPDCSPPLGVQLEGDVTLQGPGVEAGVGFLSCSSGWDVTELPIAESLYYQSALGECSAEGSDVNGAPSSALILARHSYRVTTSSGLPLGSVQELRFGADIAGEVSDSDPLFGAQGKAASRGRIRMCFTVPVGVTVGYQLQGTYSGGDRGRTIVNLTGSGLADPVTEVLDGAAGSAQTFTGSGHLMEGSTCLEFIAELLLETDENTLSLTQSALSEVTLTITP